ncbi:MAG: hypothetical protein WAT37_16580, partial [Saprospiraceae bacterium]
QRVFIRQNYTNQFNFVFLIDFLSCPEGYHFLKIAVYKTINQQNPEVNLFSTKLSIHLNI